MRKMIEYFIKHPVLGNAIAALVLVFGMFTYMSIKTTFFPPEPSRSITISAAYPGASPEEIEEGITLKIEDNLKGITGIERVTSTSYENAASINVEIQHGYDANVLLQEVNNAVDKISSFPVGMEKINIYKNEAREFVIALALSGDKDLRELKKYARRIERDLLAKEGISKISLSGFPNEEIEVSFRETDLRKYGLSFDEVANGIKSANLKITGGKIKGAREELLIRADNKEYYAEDMENHVIKTTVDGTIIRLKDIADVIDRWSEDPNRQFFNGKPAVIIDISKTNDEDLLVIADIVYGYMDEFKEKNSDLNLDVLRDGSKIIMERVDILTSNGLIGIVLVLMFLGLSLNPRLSFWVAVAIPLAFAGMFAMGPLYGLTINVMSLMAMILVIGILVDDGIVIAENIYQHYERGATPLKAALEGTMEVLPSVTSAVLTTITIFVIFFFLEGGIGDHAGDIAFVVAATLAFSLVEAVFILPAHIAHSKALHGNSKEKSKILAKSEKILFWFRDKLYAPSLIFVIKHPFVSLTIPIATAFLTIGALQGSIIKTTFFPTLEFDNVPVTLQLPAGAREHITDSLITKMANDAWAVDKQYRNADPGSDGLISAISARIGPGTHQGSLSISLISGEKREISNLEIRELLRQKIGEVPEAEKLQIGGGGRWGMPVSISLQSEYLDQLQAAKEKLKAELRRFSELKDVIDNNPEGMKEVNIKLKDKAFALGLNTSQIMDQVRSGFFGKEAQRILRGIDEVRIWVRYGESERATIGQLEDMRIRLANGREYPLGELANLTIERGVMSVYHIDGQRVIKVEADVSHSKVSVPDVIAEIKTEIMPKIQKEFPDVRYGFEGESRETAKTMSAFVKVVPPMFFLMFLLVVVTFRSFSQAAIVYLLVPFSLIGVAWGHFIQGYILSMLSFFGAIALVGIVVNDSLVFVSAFNQRIKQGLKFDEALFDAGLSRFRPVLLTSLTTIAGLGPLIFEGSFQAQFLSPMAISVAYGLLFGTVLTLLMLPAMLVINNKFLIFIRSLFSKKKLTSEDVEPAMREEVAIAAYEEHL